MTRPTPDMLRARMLDELIWIRRRLGWIALWTFFASFAACEIAASL